MTFRALVDPRYVLPFSQELVNPVYVEVENNVLARPNVVSGAVSYHVLFSPFQLLWIQCFILFLKKWAFSQGESICLCVTGGFWVFSGVDSPEGQYMNSSTISGLWLSRSLSLWPSPPFLHSRFPTKLPLPFYLFTSSPQFHCPSFILRSLSFSPSASRSLLLFSASLRLFIRRRPSGLSYPHPLYPLPPISLPSCFPHIRED